LVSTSKKGQKKPFPEEEGLDLVSAAPWGRLRKGGEGKTKWSGGAGRGGTWTTLGGVSNWGGGRDVHAIGVRAQTRKKTEGKMFLIFSPGGPCNSTECSKDYVLGVIGSIKRGVRKRKKPVLRSEGKNEPPTQKHNQVNKKGGEIFPPRAKKKKTGNVKTGQHERKGD